MSRRARALAALVALTAPVAAQPAPAPPADGAPVDDTPWGKGVSAEARATAQALLEDGNALFIQNLFREALAKYEAALAAWDHPAIRFNMVRALVNLDRPLEAEDNLTRALAYGAAPLGPEVFADASTYQRLLSQQLATLVVTCTQAGVAVAVDGIPAITCPGEHRARVRAGAHTVSAEGKDLLAVNRRETLVAGDNPAIDLRLTPLADVTVTRTRWATWKPWAITGGGVAVAGVGAALLLSARGLRDDYQAALARECGELACDPEALPVGTADLLDRAQLRNALGVGAVAVGGAAVVAGVVMVILNRPYASLEPRALSLEVTPTAGGAVVGLGGAL